jgi:splicing factor 3A subunit 3
MGHLKGKIHVKAAAKLAKEQAAASTPQALAEAASKKEQIMKAIAEIEHKIIAFADLYRERITETQSHIEKKQTRSAEEIQRDLEAEEASQLGTSATGGPDTDSDDEKDKPLYNPLNLPLDYNGKPIPYWLYKLHGLNIEYKCEICGGYSYWGPRAYERHFKEWRHAYGMKCLGIPNGKEFMNITKFDDAKALWEKLQKRLAVTEFRLEEDEEFEDHEGNVFNKKTFEDLKRQGLL